MGALKYFGKYDSLLDVPYNEWILDLSMLSHNFGKSLVVFLIVYGSIWAFVRLPEHIEDWKERKESSGRPMKYTDGDGVL